MNTYTTPSGDTLAYHYTQGYHPLVVFLGGFRSDMTGSKAMALQTACEARGQAFLRFDYHGHGQSSGDFMDGSIGRWKGNALDIITHMMSTQCIEKCVVIGSSMGGWLMTHVAMALGDAVAGMIGIAAAPDFTTDLMEHEFTPQQRAELEENGVVYVPNCMQGEPYPITRTLIEDGKQQSVLTQDGVLPITCPMILLHGTRDADVPWQTSIALMNKVASEDVRVQLLKNGDHRLSEPHQLAMLTAVLDEMLAKISKN